ncbi:hypothetical protein [Helicobacter sp. 12S02634-8]|uniref:hypothetical protein n=1 Tax=Helicobacter sp. 12S02634-8 TaxID=1476199 RepID=UPI001179CEB2|nr:hypothetical protein [Helicobacter sp. 12S02634-8]
MFYTTDGYTQDEDSKDIENCQILGFSNGLDEKSAYNNLIKENSYLKEYKFSSIIAQEIFGEPLYI